MFEAYWKLAKKPFENTTDAEFYYPSEIHQGAMLKLRYVLENRHNAAALIGATGTGKSLVIQSLYRSLPSDLAPRIHLVFPQLPADQLLQYIADELTGEEPVKEDYSIESCVRRIQHALAKNTEEGRHAILAIDEAHLLRGSDTFETLRLLLNFEHQGKSGMSLLLVGQPTMLPVLDRRNGLEERLAVKILLRPFTTDETLGYISHRLTAAGAEKPIFQPEAMEAIHQLSQGVPRRINPALRSFVADWLCRRSAPGIRETVEAVAQEMITITPEGMAAA